MVSGQERTSDRIIARLLLVLKSAHIAAGPVSRTMAPGAAAAASGFSSSSAACTMLVGP
jgi:hypothetical protein